MAVVRFGRIGSFFFFGFGRRKVLFPQWFVALLSWRLTLTGELIELLCLKTNPVFSLPVDGSRFEEMESLDCRRRFKILMPEEREQEEMVVIGSKK